MADRRAFKTDESFLEKISIGAVGTKRVFADLKQLGHNPIELERGSMSFKIWKNIKIKRVRVPDLLCVNCNERVESRAKTNFTISMSHSNADPERSWNYSLEESDYAAFVACKRIGDGPIDWEADKLVQYVSVQSMNQAYRKGFIIEEGRKGAGEGFEVRLTWPSCIASADGKISYLDSKKLQIRRAIDGGTTTLRLEKRGIPLVPLVHLGDEIQKNQVLASVVNVVRSFACQRITSDSFYIHQLTSLSLSDRYSAVKALGHFKSPQGITALLATMKNDKEHIYVRLDAALSLIRLGEEEEPNAFILQVLHHEHLTHRLEAVIVLGESQSSRACDMLIGVLSDENQHPEIRAGAAWSLGEINNDKSLGALIKSFNSCSDDIKAEAARALYKLSRSFSQQVIPQLPESNRDEQAGIAWALSKSGAFDLEELLNLAGKGEDIRKWVAWIIGTQSEQRFINDLERIREKDKEVYFAATVLWIALGSWINDLEIY